MQHNSAAARAPHWAEESTGQDPDCGLIGQPCLVNVRLRQRESILHELQTGFGVVRDDDFHDIESKTDIGITQQAQPGEAAAGNSFSFVPVYGIERPAKILPGSRFDLHENQGVAIAADEVDFPTRSTAKVTGQNFVAVLAKEFAG
jgi:hypothetical protein